MRKIMLGAAVTLAVLGSIALSGCASKPVDELKMATVAMDQARNAESREYEPIDWDRARMKWEEANALIQMGRYGEARSVLIDAVASFDTTREKAKRRVESLKIEIESLQSTAEMELKKLEKGAENPKLSPTAKRRIEAALARIDEKIAAMNADFDAKEYLRSRMEGHEAIRYSQDLRKRLGIPD